MCQKRQDEADVDNIYSNQFSPAFRDLYQKYYALQGKDALDQMPTYLNGMQNLRQATADSLPEGQRQLFNNIARRRVEMELDGMARYADQQNKVYRLETFNSTLDNLELQAADKHNDEHAFGTSLGSIRYTIDKFAAENGKSAEWARDKVAERESSAAVSRLQRMMVDNPMEAKAWYGNPANQSMIEPKARPMLEHQIKAAALPVEVKTEAQDIMGKDWDSRVKRAVSGSAPFPAASSDQPQSVDSIMARLVKQESGGQHMNDQGELVTSAEGAQGITQVMPKTGQDPGFGVAPLKNNSKEEYLRFGKDYLQAMLTEFGGDAQKATAAYNWGPQSVKDAVSKYGDDWLAHAPKETQTYVTNVAGSGAVAAGAPMMPADTRAGLGGWIAEAERRYPNDPVKRDALITQIKNNVSTIVAMQSGVQQQAHSVVTRLMMPEKGAAPTDVSEVTNTPQGQQAWAMLSPESQRGFIAWMGQNQRKAEGKALKSNADVNEEVFRRINLPADDPQKITQPGQLAPYFAKGLTRADYEWHTKLIDEQRTPDGQRLSDVRKNFFTAIKPRFDASTMVFRDEKGGEDNYRFQQFATEKERQYRAAGKDPYVLYNPASPDYLGNDVQTFQRSLQQKVQDRVASVGGAAAPASAPAPAAAPKQPVPAFPTAKNPQTGETVIFKDGKWQKP